MKWNLEKGGTLDTDVRKFAPIFRGKAERGSPEPQQPRTAIRGWITLRRVPGFNLLRLWTRTSGSQAAVL